MTFTSRTISAYLVCVAAAVLSVGCASVTVYEQRNGATRECSKWQTGLHGMSQDDIVIKHDDGSCIRVTWNKVSAWFTGYVHTQIYDEAPCSAK